MKGLRKNRLILALCILCIGLLLVACGNGAKTEQQDSSFQEKQNSQEKYVMKFGHNLQTDGSQHKGALEFKRLAEEWSEGRLEVQVYPAQQLGGSREQIEGVQTGAIEMTLQTASFVTPFAPRIAVIDTPFLWPNEEIVWEILDGEIGKKILAPLEEVGMIGLPFWGSGFKQLTSNKPIRTPQDIKGIKFRIMSSPLLIEQFETWGAVGVPVDYGEMYNALQQKIVEGQENPVQIAKLLKLWEVQEYLNMTNHGCVVYCLVMNKDWFEKLPVELQDVVMRAASEAAKSERAMIRQEEIESVALVEKMGMQIINLTDDEIAEWRKVSEACWPKFAETVGVDFFTEVQEAIEAAMK